MIGRKEGATCVIDRKKVAISVIARRGGAISVIGRKEGAPFGAALCVIEGRERAICVIEKVLLFWHVPDLTEK